MSGQTIESRVLTFIREHHMTDGGGILAAVSGGADSVCLLILLKKLQKELGFSLFALHMNHGLRGEEADRDEQFTRKLCERLKVPCTVIREDVAEYARNERVSEEEAGRILRYRHLEEEALRLSCDKIAVAHHGDDCAETVLLNLFRGSGFHGLAGIRPVRGAVIRPLLCLSRTEIEQYLTDLGETWCDDSTNAENDYVRNKIRNQLLPWAEREINSRAADHILQVSHMARMADEYFSSEAERILGDCQSPDMPPLSVPVEIFDVQPEILQQYLVLALLKKASPGLKDISERHVEAVCRLCGPGGGRFADLPHGLKAERGYRYLTVKRPGSLSENGAGKEAVCSPDTPEECGSDSLSFHRFAYEKGLEIPKNRYTKWFDYDKIKNTLFVRTRKTGDYLTLSDGKKKMISRYMIDEKIPADMRDKILLLADGNHVLWVVGYRISEYYKISDKTKNILEVQMGKGEQDV